MSLPVRPPPSLRGLRLAGRQTVSGPPDAPESVPPGVGCVGRTQAHEVPESDLAFLAVLAAREPAGGGVVRLTAAEGATAAGVSSKTWRRSSSRREAAGHVELVERGSGRRPLGYRLTSQGRALAGKWTPPSTLPYLVQGGASYPGSVPQPHRLAGGWGQHHALERLMRAEQARGMRCIQIAMYACEDAQHRARSLSAFLARGCGRRLCARCAPAVRWRKTRGWLRRIDTAVMVTGAGRHLLTLTSRKVRANVRELRDHAKRIVSALSLLTKRCPALLGLAWALDWTGDEHGIALHVHAVAVGHDLPAQREEIHAGWRSVLGPGWVASEAAGSTDVRPLASSRDAGRALAYGARGFEVDHRGGPSRLAPSADYLSSLPGPDRYAEASFNRATARNERALMRALHGVRITGSLGVCHGSHQVQRPETQGDGGENAPAPFGPSANGACAIAPTNPPERMTHGIAGLDLSLDSDDEVEGGEDDEEPGALDLASFQEADTSRSYLRNLSGDGASGADDEAVLCPVPGCGCRLVPLTPFEAPRAFLNRAESAQATVYLRTARAEAYRRRRQQQRESAQQPPTWIVQTWMAGVATTATGAQSA